jgi:hypothetical protein
LIALYSGPVEICHYGAASEEILLYPHPNIRIRLKAGDPAVGVASYLHSDQPGPVRAMTSAAGTVEKETTYRRLARPPTSSPIRQTLNKPANPLTLSTARPVNPPIPHILADAIPIEFRWFSDNRNPPQTPCSYMIRGTGAGWQAESPPKHRSAG